MALFPVKRRWYAVAAIIFAVAFVYNALDAIDLIDDHFLHVMWGRQFLAGELPLRDTVDQTIPLQAAVSALAEAAFGYRLLSEAVVLGGAFAVGAVATFALASRASGSVVIGLIAAVLQIVVAPRSYSYPKIMLYAVGLWLMWAYIDRPSRRRLTAMAAIVVVGFYFRYDHGLYLGLSATVTVVACHARDWRLALSRAGWLLALCVFGVAPFVVHIQRSVGLGTYLQDLGRWALRESQRNHFDGWPRWPLRSLGDLARWSPDGASSVAINVRWSPASSEGERRAVADRRRLQVPPEGPIDSGRFVLTDVTHDNVSRLIAEPAVEDTAGIDRGKGLVLIPGLWLWSLRLLPPLDDGWTSAACLFNVFMASIPLALLLLLVRPSGKLGSLEHANVLVAAAMAILTALGFLREPLDGRVGDAVVAPLVLLAWCAGWLLTPAGGRGSSWRRWGWSVLLLAALVPIARSAAVVGSLGARLETMGLRGAPPPRPWTAVWRRLWTSPPFDVWSAAAPKYDAVAYVRSCSSPDDPLLVLWFAPDLYYYADRPAAGRQLFYIQGYWNSPAQERANLDSLERQRPLLALSEVGHETSDLPSYPQLQAYIAGHYRAIGDLTGNDGSVIRVMVRTDAQPVSTDPVRGWPCYRR